MYFAGARSARDCFYILGKDAAAGHYDQAAAGAADEQRKKGAALPGCRCLSRTQQAGTTQCNDFIQGDERVFGADVEGAMKSDGQRSGGGHQPAHGRQVDSPFRCQRPYDNAGHPDRFTIHDVIEHLFQSLFVINKIAFGKTHLGNA